MSFIHVSNAQCTNHLVLHGALCIREYLCVQIIVVVCVRACVCTCVVIIVIVIIEHLYSAPSRYSIYSEALSVDVCVCACVCV